MIEWVYNARGDEVSMPLNFRAAINGAYPWLDRPIEQFIDDYLASSASVLILIGPPGTGKTTFIKNLIHRSGGNAKVAYDTKVMEDDQLFASFIEESDTKFLVMEDADAFLEARTDGNTMMHKFLNVSDGLLSAADKKLVFSTNLPSVRNIDSALMRPGRCFSTVTFRALTIPEAQVVLNEIGSNKKIDHDRSSITLAELLSGHQPSQTRARSIGFTP
jgi:ATP-dependent 26S proteasome regulatory subunit